MTATRTRSARIEGVHTRGPRDERGAAAAWTLLIAGGAFTLLLGLVVDGGHAIDDRLEAKRAAEQAARAGADALSAAGVRSATDAIAKHDAAAQASSILRQAGWDGTVRVDGTQVTVTVTGSTPTVFLAAIAIGSLPVHESGTAMAITGPDQNPGGAP